MQSKKARHNIYSIVEDGIIAIPGLGEGRMIPAIIVNSTTSDKLKHLLEIHQQSPPGDIVMQWKLPLSVVSKPKRWYLEIGFAQPMEFSFQIEFILADHHSLIHAIFKARNLHIAYGYKGQKVSKNFKNMIVFEIPDTDTDKLWENTLNSILKKKFSKEGLPKKKIKEAIRSHIKKMDEILAVRSV